MLWPGFGKIRCYKKVLDVLDGAGLPYELYSNIKPNPTIENVQTGVEAFKASGADYIVAIGGGSSMDTAKAIGIIIKNPEFADVRKLEGVADTKIRLFLFLQFLRLPVLLPKLRLTMLLLMQKRTVKWCA